MTRRIIFALVGLVLIASVVWLGLQSADDSRFLVWFGIASALIAPAGLALIGRALTAGDVDVLRRLSKVPELERLINEAASAEDKVRLLERERAQLEEVIAYEAARRALAVRHEGLLDDARRILDELTAVDSAAASLEAKIDSSAALPVLAALEERLQAEREGATVIRIFGRQVAIRPGTFNAMPFLTGPLVELGFTQIARWQSRRPPR